MPRIDKRSWIASNGHIPYSLRPTGPYLETIPGKPYCYTDSNNSKYLDLSAQTLNLPVGQPLESIQNAVINQIRKGTFFSSRFGSDLFNQLAAQLVTRAPEGIHVANCKLCDGSDAVETCLKIARIYLRSHETLVLPRAWHGETIATLSLSSTSRSSYTKPHNSQIYFSEESSIASLTDLADRHNIPSVVLLDPIGFSSGLFEPTVIQKDLFELKKICQKRGHFLIFDEVQTFGGFLGKYLFASEKYGVNSNAIAIGKALGCGFPVAAALYSADDAQIVRYNEAEFTFGGQPPACAAALSYLDFFDKNLKNIENSLLLFSQFIDEIEDEYGDDLVVRRIGFFATLRPKSPPARAVSTNINKRLFKYGVIARLTDFGSAVAFKSPILFSHRDKKKALGAIKKSFKHALARRVHIAAIDNKPTGRVFNAQRHSYSIWKRKTPREQLPEYVESLVDHCGLTTMNAFLRSFDEQADISADLIKCGLPVPECFVENDVLMTTHVEGRNVSDVLSIATHSNPTTAEAIFSQLVDYIDHAHEHGIIIGDRWDGNSIWDGETLHLLDFDIGYKGQTRIIKKFERVFAIFHHLVQIRDPILRIKIGKRYGREFGRGIDQDAENMFSKFFDFYVASGKYTTESAYQIHAAVLMSLAQTLGMDEQLLTQTMLKEGQISDTL